MTRQIIKLSFALVLMTSPLVTHPMLVSAGRKLATQLTTRTTQKFGHNMTKIKNHAFDKAPEFTLGAAFTSGSVGVMSLAAYAAGIDMTVPAVAGALIVPLLADETIAIGACAASGAILTGFAAQHYYYRNTKNKE